MMNDLNFNTNQINLLIMILNHHILLLYKFYHLYYVFSYNLILFAH